MESATRQFDTILEVGREMYDDLGETAINTLCSCMALLKTSKMSNLYNLEEYATTEDEENNGTDTSEEINRFY